MENQISKIKPADRLASAGEYYLSKKLREVVWMNAEGKGVISLGIGSPDVPPSESTTQTLRDVARSPDGHGYQPYVGISELCRSFAGWCRKWYGMELNLSTEIQPLTGSKKGILHAALALVNPGRQVLVPNPGYPTHMSLSRILGAEAINYNLKEEDGWTPGFDELGKMGMSRIKPMWTNYPNMPTEANATPELYRKLVDFARCKDAVIANDNPYSFILNEHPFSILGVPGAKEYCIEFSSMSKSYNMPGWRIGMPAFNAGSVQWILEVKNNMSSGMFCATQLAATTTFEAGEKWCEGNNRNYHGRRRLAGEIIHGLGCIYNKSQAGMFLWEKIPNSRANVEKLTERVLHEVRVFITPGFILGSSGRRYIHISLCRKDGKLAEALRRIKEMK